MLFLLASNWGFLGNNLYDETGSMHKKNFLLQNEAKCLSQRKALTWSVAKEQKQETKN